MNLFIDTNIFLNFYHFSADDLEKLKILKLLIEDETINLITTEQLHNEFYRNRDKKVVNAIDNIAAQKLTDKFPELSKTFNEYDELVDVIKEFNKLKNRLIINIKEKANDLKLDADELIIEIFNLSNYIQLDDEILNNAKNRFDLGNPPGKGNSYGDAVNWETLLNEIPVGEDIHIVSDDGDFQSILNVGYIHNFLKDEWLDKIEGNAYYYKSLTLFFQEHFPEIKIANEYEKEKLINELANSGSFYNTKIILGKLSHYSDFSNQQVIDILDIALSNNQILWIAYDDGVNDVLNDIIESKKEIIDPDKFAKFDEHYNNLPF